MIETILKNSFIKMPWKNGKGTTTEIHISPPKASLQKEDFLYRLSSAPIYEDGEFSIFKNKQRILIPIKGTGFKLNSQVYEKFEIAQFTGNDKVFCSLLKDAVVDFGIIYDPDKIKIQARILNLKTNITFELDTTADYFVSVLQGTLMHGEQTLEPLETLHYFDENLCQLKVKNTAILLFIKIDKI